MEKELLEMAFNNLNNHTLSKQGVFVLQSIASTNQKIESNTFELLEILNEYRSEMISKETAINVMFENNDYNFITKINKSINKIKNDFKDKREENEIPKNATDLKRIKKEQGYVLISDYLKDNGDFYFNSKTILNRDNTYVFFDIEEEEVFTEGVNTKKEIKENFNIELNTYKTSQKYLEKYNKFDFKKTLSMISNNNIERIKQEKEINTIKNQNENNEIFKKMHSETLFKKVFYDCQYIKTQYGQDPELVLDSIKELKDNELNLANMAIKSSENNEDYKTFRRSIKSLEDNKLKANLKNIKNTISEVLERKEALENNKETENKKTKRMKI